ncbi:MAG: hypothetical protein M3O46_18435 [Myxococcota bacterium]|nr:hypothetical protein [Myxococcota bacterium]
MAKRNPEEIWRQLVDEAGDDEIDRAASVSVAQAEKDLAQAGFDVAAEREKANVILRELEAGSRISGKFAVAAPQGPPPALPAPVSAVELPIEASPPVRKRRGLLLAAATIAAVAIAVVVIFLVKRPDVEANPPVSIANDQKRAMDLRRDAVHACNEQQWVQCQQGLDAAKTLDPAGDESAGVQNLRHTIDGAIGPRNRHEVPKGPDMK